MGFSELGLNAFFFWQGRARLSSSPLLPAVFASLLRVCGKTDKMAEQVRPESHRLPAAAAQGVADLDVFPADREGIPEAAGCEPCRVSSSQAQQQFGRR